MIAIRIYYPVAFIINILINSFSITNVQSANLGNLQAAKNLIPSNASAEVAALLGQLKSLHFTASAAVFKK